MVSHFSKPLPTPIIPKDLGYRAIVIEDHHIPFEFRMHIPAFLTTKSNR